MPLHDALADVVSEMELEAKTRLVMSSAVLSKYASWIKSLLKASESLLEPRSVRASWHAAERKDGRWVDVVGLSLFGSATAVWTPADLKAGEESLQDGHVYVLGEDGFQHWLREG